MVPSIAFDDFDHTGAPGTSISFYFPTGTDAVFASHILQVDGTYQCYEAVHREGNYAETPRLPMDQSLFADANSDSPFDRAHVLKINVMNVPQVDDEEEIICDVDVKPVRLTETSYAMAFANHGVADAQLPQAKIHIDFSLLIDKEQLAVERAVQVTSVNERDALLAVGGSLTESWINVSDQLNRDEALVILGALFAFIGSFLVDLINALGERYPVVPL